ncbi:MAG: diaminopimelate decarboxylase [Terriglobia bacterium]
MVLPATARTNGQGHLEIGGCDTVDLSKRFGTPLFLLDEYSVRSKCEEYRAAFRRPGMTADIIYAGKAFLSAAVCDIINEEGLMLDVSSGGELYLAHEAGFPADRIFFHGNNKTPGELEQALDYRVGRIVVDSFDELDRLETLAAKNQCETDVQLRVTPGVLPSTHEFVQTGQVDSKFGFGLAGGVALDAVQTILARSRLNLRGLHFHIGSQIAAVGSYAAAVKILMDFAGELRVKCGWEVEEVNAGGGLGIRYGSDDRVTTIAEYADVIVEGVRAGAESNGLAIPRIMVEPGRSIIGNAGVTLYTVGTVKVIPGLRTYVSVDGGMSDNLRPMLYGAEYEGLLANRAGAEGDTAVTVAGKHCESGDVLIRDAVLPAPKVGDILCTPATGAYGYVMANNYNRQPRPPVVLVRDGRAEVIVKRETYEDVVSLEQRLNDE